MQHAYSMHTATVQHSISAIAWLSIPEMRTSVYLLGIFNLVLFPCMHADWIAVSIMFTSDQWYPSCCQLMTRST